MSTFNIKWSVREHINGPGMHDGGVRDGDITTVASGEVNKEAESAEALQADLTAALEKAFPRHGLGPTYDIDRVYDIEITPI